MERFTTIRMRVVGKPSFEEIATINASYIRWLKRVRREKAVESYLSHLRGILAEGPRDGDITAIRLVVSGEESITCYPWTTEYLFGPKEDLINLIFKNQGSINNVVSKLKKRTLFLLGETLLHGVFHVPENILLSLIIRIMAGLPDGYRWVALLLTADALDVATFVYLIGEWTRILAVLANTQSVLSVMKSGKCRLTF